MAWLFPQKGPGAFRNLDKTKKKKSKGKAKKNKAKKSSRL